MAYGSCRMHLVRLAIHLSNYLTLVVTWIATSQNRGYWLLRVLGSQLRGIRHTGPFLDIYELDTH